MKKSTLIMLLAMASHGMVHSADAPGASGGAAKAGEVQRQRDPTVGTPAPAQPGTGMPDQPGAINPANGQYYPPAGNGDVINPATGERYIGTPGGYINPNNGQFMPKIR